MEIVKNNDNIEDAQIIATENENVQTENTNEVLDEPTPEPEPEPEKVEEEDVVKKNALNARKIYNELLIKKDKKGKYKAAKQAFRIVLMPLDIIDGVTVEMDDYSAIGADLYLRNDSTIKDILTAIVKK
jgi:hypothetical protein